MYFKKLSSGSSKAINFAFLQLLFSVFLFSQEWTLSKGWELLGAESDISDLSVFDLKCIEKIYSYKHNASTPWSVYPNGALKSISKGQGFWAHIKKDCTINTDAGNSPAPDNGDSGNGSNGKNNDAEPSIHNIDVNGVNRLYKVYKPSSLSDDVSLLFYFHGSIMSSTKRDTDNLLRFATKYYPVSKLGKANNMMVVYPLSRITEDGIAFWAHKPDDELMYFDKLLEHILATYPSVNAKQIYISGHSSGAAFSFKLAGYRPNKVAAAISVAGRIGLVGKGEVNYPFFGDNLSTPLIAFYGETDIRTDKMEAHFDEWHKRENQGTLNGATKEDIQIDSYSATKKIYKNGISDLALYGIKNVGHNVSWNKVGQIMMDFLKSHAKE